MKNLLLISIFLNFINCNLSCDKYKDIRAKTEANNLHWEKIVFDKMSNSYNEILFKDSIKLILNKYTNGKLESYLIYDYKDTTSFSGKNYIDGMNGITFFLPKYQYDTDSVLIRIIFGAERGDSSFAELYHGDSYISRNNFLNNPCWDIKIPHNYKVKIIDSLCTGYFLNYKLKSKDKFYEKRHEIIFPDWLMPDGWRDPITN